MKIFLSLVLLSALSLHAEPSYRSIDSTVWLEDDVRKLYPDAVLIRQGDYQENRPSAFQLKTPVAETVKEVWIERQGDWIESVTPPKASDLPSCASNEIKLLDVYGSSQIAWTKEPDKFVTAENGQVSKGGYLIKTGDGASVACLLGGVNSCRFAPNSEGRVTQETIDGVRTTIIEVKTGAVFSKVGRRSGETQRYQVKSPFGIAAAKGTDFVAVTLPNRMDVWISEGTVQLDDTQGHTIGSVSSQGQGVKIIRTGGPEDPKDIAAANSLTMGAAVSLIPALNQKAGALYARRANGEILSAEETAFLGRLHKFTWYVRALRVVDDTSVEELKLPQTETKPAITTETPTTP